MSLDVKEKGIFVCWSDEWMHERGRPSAFTGQTFSKCQLQARPCPGTGRGRKAMNNTESLRARS